MPATNASAAAQHHLQRRKTQARLIFVDLNTHNGYAGRYCNYHGHGHSGRNLE